MMYAITLHQPYATLVAIGAKQLETRSWQTGYRGPLAIHAAQAFPPAYRGLCHAMHFHAALMRYVDTLDRWEKGQSLWQLLPRGSIIATCTLSEVQSMNDRAFVPPPVPEIVFGIYGAGRFVWKLEDVQRLEQPIPARGFQKLWRFDLPPSV